MASVIERTRVLHADLEQYERKIVLDLVQPTRTLKDRVTQEHRVQQHLGYYLDSARKVLELYDDSDNSLRKEELAAISGANVVTTFYDRLKSIRDYHRRFPNAGAAAEDKADETPDPFTAEEMGGKYVDLHALYERYINLPSVFGEQQQRINYVAFLGKLTSLKTIPRHKKLTNKQYQTFVEDVLGYLVGFYHRLNALVKKEQVATMIEEDFKKRWEKKEVDGWFVEEKADSNGDAMDAQPSEKPVDSATGETLHCKICDRSFSNRNVMKHHLASEKHLKVAKKLQVSIADGAGDAQPAAEAYKWALVEERLTVYLQLLEKEIKDTQTYLEAKQTKTFEELQAENQQEELVEEEPDSDAEDEPIFNPKNVPLGWDGKPIPYWLYKLHGLNIEYECEICGNYLYRGPRAFERHFSESRHAYGMKCLGIPNTKHFFNVTKIQDAVALYNKIRDVSAAKEWRPEDEEEYEDDQGNVLNKKTFHDLKAHGLLQ